MKDAIVRARINVELKMQAAAVLKYPALKESGSPLNQQFLATIAEKRKSDPAFFNQPDWPMRAADLAEISSSCAQTSFHTCSMATASGST